MRPSSIDRKSTTDVASGYGSCSWPANVTIIEVKIELSDGSRTDAAPPSRNPPDVNLPIPIIREFFELKTHNQPSDVAKQRKHANNGQKKNYFAEIIGLGKASNTEVMLRGSTTSSPFAPNEISNPPVAFTCVACSVPTSLGWKDPYV